MMTSQEIRQSFLNFFESKQHTIVPSAPMVIKNDPTLMFTNAGMNQFKNIILGNDPVLYPRIADAQKCLRVSGKHNDLEEVGHDTYHHTMFEMLGNWSFGDYFKKEAIAWAWEYLVDVLKLPAEQLYATVFEGYTLDGLERDEEAADIWKQFLPLHHIINGSKKDNFWEMGDIGPCGPCSEIHIDLRSKEERAAIDALSLINKNHPQVIEIWNNVFMQYNRKADGSLEPLPAKVIDTGMGFERLCMAVQGVQSTYDTDIFTPIIAQIGAVCYTKYGNDKSTDIAIRVIADHIRTIAFAIADGQLPSNNKAGYVIRRILRRAVRYGYTFLKQRSAFMYKLVDTLNEVMGKAYPELTAQKTLIKKIIQEEEESFLRTLENGIKLLEKVIVENVATANTHVSGKIAFTLYDTFGFPFDLTELILRENQMSVDMEEFDTEMQKQKERARNSASIETSDWVIVCEGDSTFVGYDTTECKTTVLRYRTIIQKGEEYYQIVLSQTPFYAEMGGQVGDKGYLFDDIGTKIQVLNTKKENNLIVHITHQLHTNIATPIWASVDNQERMAVERNHSATHLLHQSLREVLGSHVEQRGSFVSSDILRFDFSHFQKLTKEEIRAIEKTANQKVRANYPLQEMRDTPIAKAQEMGAMALFGEKYGESVRVIQFGNSVELCGGTHVKSTGAIGMIRIISETSIAAGIRRIEAISGHSVEKLIDSAQDTIEQARHLLNAPDLISSIEKIKAENYELKKQVENFTHEKIVQLQETLIQNAIMVNEVRVIKLETDLPVDTIKTIAFQLRKAITEKLFFVAGSVYGGKPSLTIALSDDLVNSGINATDIVRQAAHEIEGGGGGQAFYASAGGKNQHGLSKAIEKAISLIA